MKQRNGSKYILLLAGVVWLSTILPAQGQQAVVTTIAGTGQRGNGGEGPATEIDLNYPHGVAVDDAGNVYIADTYNHKIRKVDPSGMITTIAGTGIPGYGGDGQLATNALFSHPTDVVLDNQGNFYIADWQNARVRWIDAVSRKIWTIAGRGGSGPLYGDGGPATMAQLYQPTSVALDEQRGIFYIVDIGDGHRCVRKVEKGLISTVVSLYQPWGAAVDAAGNLYISEKSAGKVRKIDTSGVMTTLAQELRWPYGMTVDDAGNLYVAVNRACDVGKMNFALGKFESVAPTYLTNFKEPMDVAVAANGDIYVADTFNHRIRKISFADPAISIPTVAVTMGEAVIDESVSLELTIANPGTADLHITSLEVDGVDALDFSVTPTTLLIPPGESAQIVVIFTPVSPGEKSATLYLTHDAAGSPATVALNGTAIAQELPQPPVIGSGGGVVGEPLLVEGGTYGGTVVTLQGSATDPDGDPLSFYWSAPGVVFDDPSNAAATGTFPLGTTVATLTVTDAGGLSATAEQVVTVEDTTPPTVSVSNGVPSLEAQGPQGVPITNPEAQAFLSAIQVDDLCDPAPSLAHDAPEDFFPFGQTTVTWTVVDASGNTASISRTLIVEDTTPPDILSIVDNQVLEATSSTGAKVTLQVAAVDRVDPEPTYLWQEGEAVLGHTATLQVALELGTHSISVTIADDSGNESSRTIEIIVQDTMPPQVAIDSPKAGSVFASGDRIDVVYTVTDAVDPEPAVTVVPGDPTGPPLEPGELILKVTARDGSGNKQTASVTVTVLPISISFDFDPNTLNIGNGNGVATGYIGLAETGATCGVIDWASLQLLTPGGAVSPIAAKADRDGGPPSGSCEDQDGDGVLEGVVKFARKDLISLVEEPAALLTIQGRLLSSSEYAAAVFEGEDEIRVIARGGGKGKEKGKLVAALPTAYALFQNVPNPFNPETTIRFAIPEDGYVRLDVFDVLGRKIKTLVEGYMTAGVYQSSWDGRDTSGQPVSSGIYLYGLQAGTHRDVKRMLLVR